MPTAKFALAILLVCLPSFGQHFILQDTFVAGPNAISAYRPLIFWAGSAQVTPQTGNGAILGVSANAAIAGANVTVVEYGMSTIEFDGTPVLGDIATAVNGFGHDTGATASTLVSNAAGFIGRITATRTDLCALCADVFVVGTARYGGFNAASLLSGNFATGMVANSDGTMTTTFSNGTTVTSTGSIKAASLLGTPTQCSTGQAPTGITAAGNATGCASIVPVARTQSASSRTLNSCFQISASRDADVRYSVQVTSTANLIGGQTGSVFLETYSDSGCSLNTQELSRFVNGNSVSLAIALTAIQIVGQPVNGYIPAGSYVKIRTANTLGTPSFSILSQQEMLY